MLGLKDFGVERHEGRLKSGVKVVLYERMGMPLMINAAFLSGSKYDPPGKDGLSHFTEHMLVAGTEKYPSKDKLAAHIERVGGMFGASTGKEIMNLNFNLAEAEDLPVAVEIMNEMLSHSLLNEKLIETERGSIVQEMDSAEANPARASGMKFTSIVVSEPALRRRILGTQETLSGITQTDLKRFFAEMLTPSRMTITVSGGVTLAELVDKLDSGLDLHDQESSAVNLPDTSESERIAVVPFDVNDQIQFDFGVQIPGFLDDHDSPALSLIGTIMGGGRASVLSRLLRYERGLVYGIGAGSYQLSSEGAWYVGGACGKDKLHEAMDIISGELQRIHEGGITREELEFAKSKRLKSLKMGLQTSGSWVGAHAVDEIFNTHETIIDGIKRIESTTMSDVCRVGEKYFRQGECRGVFAGRITKDEAVIPF